MRARARAWWGAFRAKSCCNYEAFVVQFFQHGSLVVRGEGGGLNPPQRATLRAAHGRRGAGARRSDNHKEKRINNYFGVLPLRRAEWASEATTSSEKSPRCVGFNESVSSQSAGVEMGKLAPGDRGLTFTNSSMSGSLSAFTPFCGTDSDMAGAAVKVSFFFGLFLWFKSALPRPTWLASLVRASPSSPQPNGGSFSPARRRRRGAAAAAAAALLTAPGLTLAAELTEPATYKRLGYDATSG